MSKVLYFDLTGGASGDMLLSAFIDLGLKRTWLNRLVKSLGLKIGFRLEKVKINHITANKIVFAFKKNSLSFSQINSLVRKSALSKSVKEKVVQTYLSLKETEEKVHRQKKKNFKFHHLGEPDSLIEISSFWQALEELEISECFCSVFPLSNPSPATLALLGGKKVKFVDWGYESITPTAASLLKNFPQEEITFTLDKVGYGAGSFVDSFPSDFLKVVLAQKEGFIKEKILKLEVNFDDINPQVFDSLIERLFKEGALDVYILPAIMKKNRPSFVLSVLLDKKDLAKIEKIIFEHTTTFGVRYSEFYRDKLKYKFIEKQTSLGKVKFRQGFMEGHLIKENPEYEDCKKISSRYNIPLLEVYQRILKENKAA